MNPDLWTKAETNLDSNTKPNIVSFFKQLGFEMIPIKIPSNQTKTWINHHVYQSIRYFTVLEMIFKPCETMDIKTTQF